MNIQTQWSRSPQDSSGINFQFWFETSFTNLMAYNTSRWFKNFNKQITIIPLINLSYSRRTLCRTRSSGLNCFVFCYVKLMGRNMNRSLRIIMSLKSMIQYRVRLPRWIKNDISVALISSMFSNIHFLSISAAIMRFIEIVLSVGLHTLTHRDVISKQGNH